MTVELARAYITLVPSFQGAQREIANGLADIGDQGGREAGKRFGTGFRGILGGTFLGNILADVTKSAAMAVGRSISAGFEEIKQVQVLAAQTEAVIRSTGGAAGVTADHVQDLASALQDVTATEDDAITAGANMLLTFKNIRNEVGEGNDVFDQSTAALVDMAKAMGQEPRDAAIQLGKALNDPIAGIGALSRVGVQFTADQKELIKTLVESGDVMGAQKVILGELNAQFGGSGSSYAQTYAGKLDQISNKFGDLREKVLTAALPALMSFADLGIVAISNLSNSPLIDMFGQKLADMGATATEKLKPLFDAMNSVGDSEQGFTFGGLFDELARTMPFFAALQPIVAAIAPHMPVLAAAVGELAPALADLIPALVPLIPPLTDLALAILPPLVDLAIKLAPALVGIVEALIPMVKSWTPNIEGLSAMVGWIEKANEGTPIMRDELTKLPGLLGETAPAFHDFAVDVKGGFRDALQGAIDFTRDVGVNLAGLQATVSGAFRGASSWLYDSGKAIIQGFINGIRAMIQNVRNAASNVLSTVRNFFPHSPAKEGPFSGAGWAAVRKSGEALMSQFTSGFDVDVAPAMLGSLGKLRAAPIAGGGGGGGLSTGDVNIYTTRPASEAFVDELRQRSFRLGF